MELLVVIAIIMLLLGLLLPALSGLVAGGQKNQLHTAMQALESAHAEYRALTNEPVNIEGSYPFSRSDAEPTVPGASGGSPDSTIELFIAAAWQTETGERIINGIPDSLLVDENNNGFYEVVDPWGNELVYRPYTPESAVGSDHSRYREDSQTYRNVPFAPNDTGDTDYELPARPDPFFASAGPDGDWVAPEQDEDTDDIYSFEVER
jgi:type II secretory pathway pseudopilin PulG